MTGHLIDRPAYKRISRSVLPREASPCALLAEVRKEAGISCCSDEALDTIISEEKIVGYIQDVYRAFQVLLEVLAGVSFISRESQAEADDWVDKLRRVWRMIKGVTRVGEIAGALYDFLHAVVIMISATQEYMGRVKALRQCIFGVGND